MNGQKAQVPNSTIAVLLVLAIMVSAIGTWTVLQKVKELNVNAGPTGLTTQDTTNTETDTAAPLITGSVVDETGQTEPEKNETGAQ